VLLTRSPLGHPPEGGASLDLHVLSTPPAFVLSQDQTLRECLLTAGRAGLSTFGKSPSCDGFNHWFIRAGCFLLDVPKESFTPSKTGRGRELYGTNFRHAVEFSRSGRTPSGPFRADRGQPEIRYPVGCARSNTTGTARTPTWSGRLARSLRASCLGERPPGATRPSPTGEVRDRGSVSRTTATLVRRDAQCKFRVKAPTGPILRGPGGPGTGSAVAFGLGLKCVT
jgi:hypothetical protein